MKNVKLGMIYQRLPLCRHDYIYIHTFEYFKINNDNYNNNINNNNNNNNYNKINNNINKSIIFIMILQIVHIDIFKLNYVNCKWIKLHRLKTLHLYCERQGLMG